MEPVDVLIVGGGLIGLSLGAALADSDLRVVILDHGSKPEVDPPGPKHRDGLVLQSSIRPRVSAIAKSQWTFLTRIGARLSAPSYSRMEVWDGEGTGTVSFSAEDLGEAELGYIVENDRLCATLIDQLHTKGTVTVLWDAPLVEIKKVDDGYVIDTENGKWHTTLLVGADGGRSQVRKMANLSTVSWSYDQHGVVAAVETEKSHGGAARQWFTSGGIVAFLPLADSHLCSIVLSCENAEAILAMDESEVAELLYDLTEGELGKIVAVDQRLAFPLIQQHSFRYVRQNLALIGDAAHTIHPLAGQGANIGLADAEALSLVLKQARLEGRSTGDIQLLNSFQRARRSDNVMTAALMEVFFRGFASQNPAVRWLRNKSMNVVNDSGFLKTLVTRYATLR
ncbi:MAG TPA: 2-octaprenyl-3-methyl-6-methoxy-1,4-benzoquinol hydroxylase [Gammaproteobacteria bacterium]|nr:2-octaprenyl-3-methyl-6-methoxy-1,4-benzoquinol hydroxylase [Gammaproteobacteria bacterium]